MSVYSSNTSTQCNHKDKKTKRPIIDLDIPTEITISVDNEFDSTLEDESELALFDYKFDELNDDATALTE